MEIFIPPTSCNNQSYIISIIRSVCSNNRLRTLFTIYWKLLGIGLAVDLFNAYQHYMDKTLGGTGKGTAN